MEKSPVVFMKLFLRSIGLNIDTDPNLKDTPERITRMLRNEFLLNMDKEPDDDLVKTFPNDKNYDEIILSDNIPFVSLCSHHFLPFPGLAWFLYIPDKVLLGASKAARTIEFFSRKAQLQENLGIEVMDHLMKEADPLGAMLVMRAVHGCMACRGIKTGEGAGLITSITRGAFRVSSSTKEEGLALIQLSLSFRK